MRADDAVHQLYGLFDVVVVTDSNHKIDAAGVLCGVVRDWVGVDQGVWDGKDLVVRRFQNRVEYSHCNNLAGYACRFDDVTGFEGPEEYQHHPGREVGQRVLQRQTDGQARRAHNCEERCRIDPERPKGGNDNGRQQSHIGDIAEEGGERRVHVGPIERPGEPGYEPLRDPAANDQYGERAQYPPAPSKQQLLHDNGVAELSQHFLDCFHVLRRTSRGGEALNCRVFGCFSTDRGRVGFGWPRPRASVRVDPISVRQANSVVSSLKHGLQVVALVVAAGIAAGCATAPQSATRAGDADFHLVLAEIARERGQFAEAARHYRDAALVSTDPEVAERATQMAWQAEEFEIGLDSASRWQSLAPEDLRPIRFLAGFELRLGNVRPAADQFSRLVENAADVATGLELIGADLTQVPDPRLATDVMVLLNDRFPGTAEGDFALARLALRSGDREMAFSASERAANAAPDKLEVQLLYARALFLVNRTEESLGLAERLAEANPDAALAQLQYAELLLAAGQSDPARDRLNGLLEVEPGLEEAIRALAFLDLAEGNLEGAEERFGQLRLGQRYRTESFYYLARLAENQGQHLKAIRFFSRVTEGGRAAESQSRVAQIYFRELNDAETALQHLEGFGIANPTHRVAMQVARAQLLVQMDRVGDARSELAQARKEFPEEEAFKQAEADLYVLLSQRAYDGGDTEAASDYLKQGRDLFPKHRGLRYAQALDLESKGKVRKAIKMLEALAREEPDDPVSLNALGYTLTDRTDRHDEARDYIERALVLDPNNPAILDSMGWVLFNLGEWTAALGYLERAYALEADPEIAAHLVRTHLALGNRAEAEAILVRALEGAPEDERLNRLSSELEL